MDNIEENINEIPQEDINPEPIIDKSNAYDVSGLSNLLGKMYEKKPMKEYVPISETYQPMAETYKGTDYKPLEWENKPYQKLEWENKKYEPMQYEPMPYEKLDYQPMVYEKEEWQSTNMFDEQNKPWESSPIFDGTGMGSILFGNKKEIDEPQAQLVNDKYPIKPQSMKQGVPIQIVRSVDFPGEHNRPKLPKRDLEPRISQL